MFTDNLILYKNFKNGEILEAVSKIYDYRKDTQSDTQVKGLISLVVNRLVELAYSHGYSGDLWHTYLTFLLANNENPYSMACEIRGAVKGSINDAALHDFAIFKELFDIDLNAIFREFQVENVDFIRDYDGGDDQGRVFNKRVRDRIVELSKKLSTAESALEIKEMVTAFYKDFGVGKFGLHKAFRVEHEDDGVQIIPITNITHVQLDDLVGYEIPKQKLIDNTEAFVEGRPAIIVSCLEMLELVSQLV